VRKPLALDPSRAIAIKRSVHELEIDAPADEVAVALIDVLADPAGDFGPIRVRRPADRAGRPFAVGERFQGSLQLGGPAFLRPITDWIESTFLADHCEVVELAPRRARYRYLSGTPLAGESTIEVRPLGPARCRVLQTFEYQELGLVAMLAVQRVGVRMHDRAFVAQAERAAARVGARVVSTTIAPSDPT
jgi:hypothetical protein